MKTSDIFKKVEYTLFDLFAENNLSVYVGLRLPGKKVAWYNADSCTFTTLKKATAYVDFQHGGDARCYATASHIYSSLSAYLDVTLGIYSKTQDVCVEFSGPTNFILYNYNMPEVPDIQKLLKQLEPLNLKICKKDINAITI